MSENTIQEAVAEGQQQDPQQQPMNIKDDNGDPATSASIQSLIAKELTGLSREEREKALDDVHGISNDTKEDPGFINLCLKEMADHLNTMKAGTSYELAESLSPEYVQNPDFRLMFIRADFYVTKAAAERMIKFFDFKKRLFGTELLGREITLNDFDEDGMGIMKSGYAQISPYRDMSGRPIVLFVLEHKKNYQNPENLTRAGYYMFMVATKMPEAQRKGITCVYYYLDNNTDASSLRSANSECRKSLPVYFASLHLCYDDEAVYEQLCENVKKLNASTRARFRNHGGTHEEIAKELSAYGIPRQAVPINQEGQYILEPHLTWLEERLKAEQKESGIGAPSLEAVAQVGLTGSASSGGNTVRPTSDESSIGSSSTSMLPNINISSSSPNEPLEVKSSSTTSQIAKAAGVSPVDHSYTPHPEDVLFGRGKTVVEHPGNMRFRHVVDIYMNEYESAGRLEKTCIAEVIVRMVKDSNGKFLKRDEGGDWEEVDDSTARKKVAHAFRNRRKLHGY